MAWRPGDPMKARRICFEVHSWLGLKLSILMTFILATGTLAVFSHDIDWLLNPEMRALTQGTYASHGAIFDAARGAYPDGDAYYMVHPPTDPWRASEVDVTTPAGDRLRLWFDPVTAKFQGATSWFNVQRFLRQAHRHLMLPNDIGIPIVTLLAFPLLAAMATGLVVYRKFWRGFLAAPRFDKPPRVWLGDIHRLGALWSLWFLPIIAITSIWYLVEEWGGAAPRFPAPAELAPREAPLPADFDGRTLDTAINVARQTLPALDVRTLRLPTSPGRPLVVEGQTGAMLVRNRANAVSIDPKTLTVAGSFDGHQLGVHQRIAEMADPLHFGTFGGLATRIVWFVFGMVLTGLSVTGIYIYGLRIFRPASPARSRTVAVTDSAAAA